MQQEEISLTEFINGYADGSITDVLWVGGLINRVYGKTTDEQADNPDNYIVVWATTPA